MKNKVQLIGYLGQDPELRNLENDMALLKCSIATHDRVKNSAGEYEDRTIWHSVVMFNKLANRAAKKLKCGDLVAVEGPLSYRSYTNAEEQQVTRTEVIARDFAYLGSPSAKARSAEPATV
ncbi:MAG: single-stranded DNA-binding protein [Schleiferiaceae bacterium]|jgi:single-strand DNA-binding protein